MSRPLHLRPVFPWLLGFLIGGVICSTYVMMFAYRGIYQSKYPDLAAQWSNDGPFTLLGVYGPEVSWEEVVYAAKLKEASERWVPYDPFVNENRSTRLMLTDPLTHRIMSLPHLLLQDIDLTWFFWRFVCAVLWFVLLYKLTLDATGSWPVAVFAGVFVTCFSYLLTFLFLSNMHWTGNPAKALAHNLWSLLSFGRTEMITRMPRPGFTYMILFAASLLLIKSAEDKRWKWAVASGVAGGLTAYIRPDIWSTYMATTFLFAALTAYKTRFHKGLAGSAILSLLISVPFMCMLLGVDKDTMQSAGVTHAPTYHWAAWLYLAGAFALVRSKTRPVHLLLAATLVTMFLILHAPLALGFSVQTEHWQYLVNIFFFIGALSFIPTAWKNRPRLWLTTSALLATLCLTQNSFIAATSFTFYGIPRDYAAAFSWLSENAPRDSVVVALDPEVNVLLPAYTHSKVSLSPFTMPLVSDYPAAKNLARLHANLELFGADRERFLKECFLEAEFIDRRLLSGAYRRRTLPSLYLRGMMTGFSAQEASSRFREAGRRPHPRVGRTDYIWVGAFEKDYGRPDFPEGSGLALEEVFRSPTVVLYRNTSSDS